MNGLEARLRTWRREFVRSVLVEGSARFAVVLAGMILTAAALDAALTLPLAARWALFGAMVVGSAAGLLRYFLLPVIRLDVRGLLREACARYSRLAPYLLPAWELSRAPEAVRMTRARSASSLVVPAAHMRQVSPPGAAGNTSAALAAAHLDQTERLLSELPELPLFAARLSRGARRGLIGLCACSGIVLPWLYQNSPGMGRILVPWKEVPIEATIDVSPGNLRAAWGSPVTVTARPRRRPMEGSLGLWIKTENGPWTRSEWDQGEGGEYVYRVPQLTQSLQYRIGWRDRRSSVYALEPIPYPQLADAKVRTLLPGRSRAEDAAAEKNLEDAGGEVSALRGSWIVVRGRPTRPLSKAEVRVSYLNVPVALRPKSSGEVEAGFPLAEDGTFQFDLISAEGVADPHPVAYALKALADQPPTVELLSPAFEVEASPRDPLTVTFEAHDDLGLASASLLYHLPGGPEVSVPIERFVKQPTDHIGDYAWDLSKLPLGARVEFRIRVTDNCALGPQPGYSKTGVVRLADLEGAHAGMEGRWMDVQKRLEDLAGREREAGRLLKSLEDAGSEAQARELRGKMGAMDAGLSREWPEDAKAFEEFTEGMSKDPYANPGMTETAKALADEISDLARQEMPAASRSTQKGDWKDAKARHSRLEAGAGKAARLMDKGREMQGLQDFWNDAQRMDQAGSELSSALSQMAKNPKRVSAEDRRKLDAALKDIQDQMGELAKAVESLPKPSSPAAADRRKVYVVPLNKARRTADALRKAVEAGDYAQAAKLAQQLSEELSRVRQAIADAARAASQEESGPESGSSGENRLSQKMEKVMSHWQEAIDEQNRSLGLAQKLEEERRKSLLDAQKKMLGDLAARQKAALEKALSWGAIVPSDAVDSMREILKEFEAKEVSRAPDLLAGVVRRLGAQASADPPNAPALSQIARDEQGILDDLNRGVEPPPMSGSQLSDSAAAAAVQGQARRKTAGLESELRSLEAETATLPSRAIEPVAQAQGEQGQAMGDLRRLDASSASKREQKALDLLEQGMKDMASAIEQQKKIEAGAAGPFSPSRGARPGGPRAPSGADTGFVPLPSAEEYQPTREIRRDLEKSLQEKRPPSYDKIIKDYFKRISQ